MLECTGVLMPVADRSNYFTRIARGLPLSWKVKYNDFGITTGRKLAYVG